MSTLTNPSNSTEKLSGRSTPIRSDAPGFQTFRLGFRTLCLVIAVLISGLAIIYLAHLNRCLAITIETEIATQNQLQLEWGKLLLERSTWATQARIEPIAQQAGMHAPTEQQTVIIKPLTS